MITFQSGVLDRARMVSNVLLIVLLAGNIYFSVQYIENIKFQQENQTTDNTAQHIAIAHFLNFFIDTVLNTKGTISYDDRVKLENDIHQIGDASLIKQWNTFVASKDGTEAQQNAITLMSMLSAKMI